MYLVIAFGLVALQVGWVLLVVSKFMFEGLHKKLNVPIGRILKHMDRYVTKVLRNGLDHAHLILYHKPSGIMIHAYKRVFPPHMRLGKVRITVTKVRVKNDEEEESRYGVMGRVRHEGPEGKIVVDSFRADFHIPDEGEILKKVECGSFPAEAEEAIREMLLSETAFRERPVVDLWSKRVGAWWAWGKLHERCSQGSELLQQERRTRKMFPWPSRSCRTSSGRSSNHCCRRSRPNPKPGDPVSPTGPA